MDGKYDESTATVGVMSWVTRNVMLGVSGVSARVSMVQTGPRIAPARARPTVNTLGLGWTTY